MAIRKSDLKDFIEAKAKKRKDTLWGKAKVVVETSFKPVIYEVFVSIGPVERLAQQFHDALLKMQEDHPRFQRDWKISNLARDTNDHVIGLRDDMVREMVSRALSNLLKRATNGLFIDLEPLIPDLKDQLTETIEEYQALEKLTSEILTIVDASHNGDKAYKQLIELGVDLTDFDTGSKSLPAVVKLSVNPCLINGNCG